MEKQLSELENREAALALRGLDLDPESKIALKGLRTTLGKDTGPKKTIDTSRLFPKEEVDAEKARVAGAGKKDGAGTGKAGVESLFTTDPAKILEQRRKLLEAQGIGAFGEDVKKMLGESEEKTKKGLEGLKLTRAATAGAKAVGGRGRERKTGLEALAAAVSGAAEGAGSVAERELEVQSKFDEFRMKQAMAKDAYERGEVGKAQELAMSAQKDQRDFQLEKEKLDVLKDRVAAAAAAKGTKGKIPETLLTQFQKEIAEIEGAFSSGAIDETEYARRMASADRRQRDLLGSIMLANMEFGERATTE